MSTLSDTDILFIDWNLHFHEKLLYSTQFSLENPTGALDKNMRFCHDVQAIISIGCRRAWSQFTHRNITFIYT